MKNISAKEKYGYHFPAVTMLKNGNKMINRLLSVMLVAIVMLACSNTMLLAKESTLKAYFLINGKWKKGTLKGDGISINGDIVTANPPCTLETDDGSYYDFKAHEPIIIGYKPAWASNPANYYDCSLVAMPWFPSEQIISIKCLTENWGLFAQNTYVDLVFASRESIEKQILLLTMLSLADTTGTFTDDYVLALFFAMNTGVLSLEDCINDFLAVIPTDMIAGTLEDLYLNDSSFQICGLPCATNPDTVANLIPMPELHALFEQFKQTSPDFQAFLQIVESQEIEDLVATIKSSQEYQDCIANSQPFDNANLMDAICSAAGYKVAGSGAELISNSISAITLYPNPTDQDITISFNLDNTNDVRIVVCDITDRELLTLYNDVATVGQFTKTFSVKTLPAGAYYVKIISGNTIITEQFVVQ